MINSNIITKDLHSTMSTEEDSGQQYEDFSSKTIKLKHKTQLCKTFSELGYCPYEYKCRFAHGKHQLVQMSKINRNKNIKCKGFLNNGCCTYGIRCKFVHAELNWENKAILMAFQAICVQKYNKSKIMNIY